MKCKYCKISNESGFTLVEMAVVVLIIGILIASIVSGQMLIRSARIRSVITEINGYQSMVNIFLEKYSQMPGDLGNATSWFDTTKYPNVINGDGNGQVVWTYNGSITSSEGAQAWYHFMAAGIPIALSATGAGTVNAGTSQAIIGTNVPASKMPLGGYFFDYDATKGYNYIGLGEQQATGANNGAVMSADDARDMDSKFDDGLASSGRVFGNGASCTDGGGNYVVTSDTTPVCWMEVIVDPTLTPH